MVTRRCGVKLSVEGYRFKQSGLSAVTFPKDRHRLVLSNQAKRDPARKNFLPHLARLSACTWGRESTI
jgi:hypothetical protein